MTHGQETPTHTRRTVLKAGGAVAIAGILSPGAVIAQTDLPLEIEQFPEPEYVVIRNIGDEEVDITGYQLNFDAEGGNDQIEQLAGEVVIGPDEEIVVPTGAEEVDADNIVELTEPYDGHILANDGSDVVALLTPDDEVVVTTDGAADPGDGNGDDDGGDDGDDDSGDDGDGGDNGDDGDEGDDGDDGADDDDGGDDGDDGDDRDDGEDDDGMDDEEPRGTDDCPEEEEEKDEEKDDCPEEEEEKDEKEDDCP